MSGWFYVCSACGRRLESGWTEAEAKAEAAELYPGLDVNDGPNPSAIVCDDCFQIAQRTIAQ